MTTWTLDPTRTSIRFTARHMVITKVRGAFKTFRGTIDLYEDDLTKSTVDVTIDAASVDTRESLRDGYLKSADFFDVEKFPSLTFKSKTIRKKGKQDYDVAGDLTIHGVTREIVLDARFLGKRPDPVGTDSVGFTAKAVINREDFGLKFSQVLEAGGVLVGTKIEIDLDVLAVHSKID